MRGVLPLLALGLLASCGKPLTEGQYEGGCSNELDDDGDQLFDCGDPDCFGSPVCKEDGGGTDTSDTAKPNDKDVGKGVTDTYEPDSAVDPGEGVYNNLKTFAMTLNVDWDGDELANTTCREYFKLDSCACSAIYYGEGKLVESEGTRNMYLGDWELLWTDCWDVGQNVTFNDGSIWRPPAQATAAYHTFRWKPGLNSFNNWVVHGEESNNGVGPPAGTSSYVEEERFFVRAGLGQTIPYDIEKMTSTFSEVEVKPVDLIFFKSTVRFKWVFSEDNTIPELRSTVIIPD